MHCKDCLQIKEDNKLLYDTVKFFINNYYGYQSDSLRKAEDTIKNLKGTYSNG